MSLTGLGRLIRSPGPASLQNRPLGHYQRNPGTPSSGTRDRKYSRVSTFLTLDCFSAD